MSDNKEKYTPQELARMTGEAMIAWSKDKSVKTQVYTDGTWSDDNFHRDDAVDGCLHVPWRFPRRIKPAKRTAPLDKSDFVGPNRVTHVRQENSQVIWAVAGVYQSGLSYGGGHTVTFDAIWRQGWTISRDNGLTWGPAEKEVEL